MDYYCENCQKLVEDGKICKYKKGDRVLYNRRYGGIAVGNIRSAHDGFIHKPYYFIGRDFEKRGDDHIIGIYKRSFYIRMILLFQNFNKNYER